MQNIRFTTDVFTFSKLKTNFTWFLIKIISDPTGFWFWKWIQNGPHSNWQNWSKLISLPITCKIFQFLSNCASNNIRIFPIVLSLIYINTFYLLAEKKNNFVVTMRRRSKPIFHLSRRQMKPTSVDFCCGIYTFYSVESAFHIACESAIRIRLSMAMENGRNICKQAQDQFNQSTATTVTKPMISFDFDKGQTPNSEILKIDGEKKSQPIVKLSNVVVLSR